MNENHVRRPVTVTGEDWFEVARTLDISDETVVRDFLADNPAFGADLVIPKRVTIETIFGCNARCGMCVIDQPTERIKGVMPMAQFTGIIDKLAPYRDRIEMMDFFALGEPLIDSLLFDRIRYAKARGFRRLAFATNAHLLTKAKRKALLESGIDTVIFSIDGITKATHESIRERVNFDKVMENVQAVIRERDAGDFKTRFVVRFVRQARNRHEWDEYKAFWSSRISPGRNDVVTSYDMHTWGGQVANKDEVIGGDQQRDEEIERLPCHHVFDKLTILADGSIPLCSEDILEPAYGFGLIGDQDPIQAFNSARLRAMRRLHLAGRKTLLKGCSECTLLYSEPRRGSD
ncbi:radical SAM/SPASM domain-containing protein [Magnetospirillum sp. SS-4]|uniref:radical SAM/SPASM domain-containing protein n=1 Tax=Magnetospirillum sp. SS-4 TaxID=2681465 RepID=UPI00137FD2CE|nr:radical SAM/SPASM domain-containing protein [Magnetospirillum sp. SS-4]CAA7614502.1 putative Predicted Fe-S oxidoreductase [Magnetospirillum sp. SS-4]